MNETTFWAAQTERLRAGLGEHIPTVHPGACLNAHHRGAACTACVDVCPPAALTITQGVPQLQTDRCVACGLCLVACPVDAWRQDSPPERKLIARAAELPEVRITVVCALHPHPERPAAPAETVLHHRRCLAALDLGDLLALCDSGRRTVWLDDMPCPACPLQAAAVLEARVAAANQLLVAYGQPDALALASTAKPEPRGRVSVVIDVGQPKLSRRQFLGALRHTRAEPDSPPLSARQRLLAALPPVEDTAGDAAAVTLPPGVPFARVAVNPARCSGCGLCARFCPTAALTWAKAEASSDEGDTPFVLGFVAAACVACPVCTVACPEEAIRLTDGVKAAALAAAQPIALLSGRLVPCSRCGMPTAATAGSATCHVCRRSVGPVMPLQDGAGLMADLLQRSARPETT